MWLTAVKRSLPEPVASVRRIEKGTDFLVAEINDRWIFRFPRDDAARAKLRKERAFLAVFAALSPLPVPVFCFEDDDFVGYQRIPGTELSAERYAGLTSRERTRVAGQLGAFLSALHSFPVHEAEECGAGRWGWQNCFRRAYQYIEDAVLPVLSPSTRRNTVSFFQHLLSIRWEPSTVHGDLVPQDHLFLDDRRGEVCGVIDFADLTIEPAAADFSFILGEFGEDALREALKGYSPRYPVEEFVRHTKILKTANYFYDDLYCYREFGPDDLDKRLKAHAEYLERLFSRSSMPT